jgi:alpha-L-fucosidase
MVGYGAAMTVFSIVIVQSTATPFLFPNELGRKWFDAAKFGLFMHWGPVSQWGTEISFPLVCSSLPCTVAGPNRSSIRINNTDELSAHRHAYANLAKTFDPSKFDPDGMARLAKMAGFRYLVFTAEHCDGFANFDSNVSSYNIMNTAYGKDTLGMLTESFRAQGLRVGIYFCPSTWNNNDYWAPDAYTALARACAPNYNPPSQPETWQAYLSYLHSQLTEIAVQYKPDLVWIDCGQDGTPAVDTMIEKVGSVFQSSNPEVVIQVRESGDWEDYLELGDHSESQASNIMGRNYMTAGVHFEVPSTLGHQWAYDPSDTYRSAEDVILNLITITAKGGNYLLNLGPGPDGLWPEAGISVFSDLASWMAVNAEAIHDTVPVWPSDYTVTTQFLPNTVQPYRFYTTASSDGSTLYAILPESSMTNSNNSGYIMMPFVRSTNMAKTLEAVQVTLVLNQV